MSDNNEKELIEKYIEFFKFSQKDKTLVSLVMNSEINHIAVKKTFKGKISPIYKKIKSIDNVHLPKVFFMHEEEDYISVIEEYIEGITLQELLLTLEQIDEGKLLDIILQLCEPLNILHTLPNPIIHRDIKPSNIIMSKSGVLKLIDFDASREYKSEAIKDTISLGTIEYAAPEQFGYSQTDVRSDIYAIGMLISDFLQKAEKEGYSYKHISELKKIVDKCTMFDPNQRFQNINELQDAVYRIEKAGKIKYKILGISALLSIAVIMLLIINWTLKNSNHKTPDVETISDQNPIETEINNTIVLAENKKESDIKILETNDISIIDEQAIDDENNILEVGAESEDIDIINIPSTNIENDLTANNNENNSNEIINTVDSNTDLEMNNDNSQSMDEDNIESENNQKNTVISDGSGSESESEKKHTENDDKIDSVEPSTSSNDLEPVTSNHYIDYYKNPQYREDIKIYVQLNKASKIEYLSLLNYGHINPSNYYLDGNVLIIKKEYLDTLPRNDYTLFIAFDKGNPTSIQFGVHAENEDSPYGIYRLSHYYREFYTSSSEDFTYLVYNIGNTKIKDLWNDTVKIDSSYYKIEDNGYVVTLDQKYLKKFTEGTLLRLQFEFDNGNMRDSTIKIMSRSIKQPSLLVAENNFIKSSPQDVSLKIIWNEAINITTIFTETKDTPTLSTDDYQLEDDIFIVKKEFLQKLDTGTYKWTLIFDTGFGNTLTINILN